MINALLETDRIEVLARTFAVYYDMQKEWPADSLERRRAILG